MTIFFNAGLGMITKAREAVLLVSAALQLMLNAARRVINVHSCDTVANYSGLDLKSKYLHIR